MLAPTDQQLDPRAKTVQAILRKFPGFSAPQEDSSSLEVQKRHTGTLGQVIPFSILIDSAKLAMAEQESFTDVSLHLSGVPEPVAEEVDEFLIEARLPPMPIEVQSVRVRKLRITTSWGTPTQMDDVEVDLFDE